MGLDGSALISLWSCSVQSHMGVAHAQESGTRNWHKFLKSKNCWKLKFSKHNRPIKLHNWVWKVPYTCINFFMQETCASLLLYKFLAVPYSWACVIPSVVVKDLRLKDKDKESSFKDKDGDLNFRGQGQGLELQGREQRQGIENWSSRTRTTS